MAPETSTTLARMVGVERGDIPSRGDYRSSHSGNVERQVEQAAALHDANHARIVVSRALDGAPTRLLPRVCDILSQTERIPCTARSTETF